MDESLFFQEAGDWRHLYLDFLQHCLLPPKRSDTMKIKTKSSRFFLEGGLVFRRSFNQASSRCIVGDEITNALQKVYAGECGERQGGLRLSKQIMHLSYYEPTMEANSLPFTRRCQTCQFHRNKIHASAVELHSITTPSPFTLGPSISSTHHLEGTFGSFLLRNAIQSG